MINPLDYVFPHNTDNIQFGTAGLTKREYIATHVMAGLFADPNVTDFHKAAIDAVKSADYLIQELNKPITPTD